MPKPSWPSLSMPLMLSVPSSQTRTFGVWIVAPMLQPSPRSYWAPTLARTPSTVRSMAPFNEETPVSKVLWEMLQSR